jgi:hypothetical protein
MNIKVMFCKKRITSDEWKELYSHTPMYSSLKTKEGNYVMFSRVDDGNPLPDGISLLTDEELYRYDKERRANGITPYCLEDIAKVDKVVEMIEASATIEYLKGLWNKLPTRAKLISEIKNAKNQKKLEFNKLV